MIASPPFFVATTTCEYFNPQEIGLGGGRNTQYSQKECVTEYGIDEQYLELLNGQPATSSASSTDWSVQPVFTGGDILLITLNLFFLAVIVSYFVVKSLGAITVHKKYLQYHGGDVEVRDDL